MNAWGPPQSSGGAAGGVIDNDSPCFTSGGPSAYLRRVSDAGYDGSLIWTHTTDATTEANYAQWDVELDTTTLDPAGSVATTVSVRDAITTLPAAKA